MQATRTERHSRLQTAVLVLSLLWIGSCTAVNHLRDAQDAFSQAAALENTERFNDSGDRSVPPASSLANLSAVRAGYASCLNSLEQIDGEQKAQLVADQLWGAKLTLEALAQWRLGQHGEALTTVTSANALSQPGEDGTPPKEQLFPRDRALLVALPGLINTDLAYAQILGHSRTLDELKEKLAGKEGAIATLAKARDVVDQEHPLQVYLIQAQLAAYRNYQIAHQILQNKNVPDSDAARQAAKTHLADLKKVLESQSSDSAQLIAYWNELCNIDPAD